MGRTGSGKTTLAELIMGLYQTSAGEIIVDNENINKLNLTGYRKQIGYIPQDVFFYFQILFTII
ncbi:MAG: ATP-binding cassette domain-containing protein [Chitinophagales bacterium]